MSGALISNHVRILVVLTEPEMDTRPTLVYMRIQIDRTVHAEIRTEPKFSNLVRTIGRKTFIKELTRSRVLALVPNSTTIFNPD
jgi:hypothetical protein